MNSLSGFDSGDLIKLTFYYGEKITDCNIVISRSVEKRQCLLCSQTYVYYAVKIFDNVYYAVKFLIYPLASKMK